MVRVAGISGPTIRGRADSQHRRQRLQPDEGGRKPVLPGGRECGRALADIDVKAGTFSYELTTTGLGNPANTLTARSGSTLLFWDAKVPLNKNITLENGSTIHAGSGTANSTIGPITLAEGMANLSSASGVIIYYNGAINGPGGIIKGDAGSVHLTAANSFAGNVIHNYGNLLLSNSLAVGNNKTLSVNYNTGVSGGNGVRLYLRNGITTPSDVTGVFTSTSSGGDYRTSITSDVLTNTWSGPDDRTRLGHRCSPWRARDESIEPHRPGYRQQFHGHFICSWHGLRPDYRPDQPGRNRQFLQDRQRHLGGCLLR